MVRSMTAFAREAAATEQGLLTVELRSVNHRYLECSFRIPEVLRELEPALREQARGQLARGKVDCTIRLQAPEETGSALALDQARLADVQRACQRVAEQFGSQAAAISPLDLLQFPGVCQRRDEGSEALLERCATLYGNALNSLNHNREREGQNLAALVLARLDAVATETAAVGASLPALLAQQQQRLRARIAELAVEHDESRLEQEIVYLAQKADVAEELDRLHTHLDEVRRTLNKGGPCGRRLDFLMQELNREANTLSSKSIASETTHSAVNLKVLIEQMREQIQNIE